MGTVTTHSSAPDFDFTTAAVYPDEYGQWNLDRDWNKYPAREHEIEQLYLTWLSLARVTSELAYLVANDHVVVAPGLDRLAELGVVRLLARFLDTVGKVVMPAEEVRSDGAGSS